MTKITCSGDSAKFRLWISTESKNFERPITIHLILMDNYGHRIYAMAGNELFNKFELSLKEEAVFIKYNFSSQYQ
ncbi:hypothetical protein MTR_6g016920 [Medicago truncatula]|uniref:Uncharacterized protein n=1 Tax=Medicago truncatula TaxID=3880 RepID=A0A072U828_MEDTR|nr:hypothetical protein MTR_6g016920 [Medicago truncatula]